MINFKVPTRCVPKARPRVVANHTYTPKRTKDCEVSIRMHAMHAMGLNHFFSCHPGEIEITITFAFKGGKIGDIDNLCKTVLDGLQGACYFNDSQVKNLSASIIVSDEDYILIEVEFKGLNDK